MRLFLLAGEPSGDALGAALMRGLKELAPDAELRGVGGPLMQGEGLTSLFPMEELSVMGIAEVIPRYPALRRRLVETAETVVRWKPDALITIDSPDFSLRLAARVRVAEPSIRTVHYVAPSVWAWRPKRAEKMARHVDQVLALLPFESPYMEAAGMRCDFVGHPVATMPIATEEEVRAFRDESAFGDAPLLLVLPGSRASEVSRLLPIFGETVRRVVEAKPEVRIVVPAASAVERAVRDGVGGWLGDPIVIAASDTARKRAAFRAADAALAASGTVSLELAANGTPMVVAYDVNWLTRAIMARMALVDTVTLVNLVSETRVVPEFLGRACRSEQIAPALLTILTDPAARDAQAHAMRLTMERLGRGGEAPGLRAARAVLNGLGAL